MSDVDAALGRLAPAIDIDLAVHAFQKRRSRKHTVRVASRAAAALALRGIGIGGLAMINAVDEPSTVIATAPTDAPPPTTADPLASDPAYARLFSHPGESAQALAERISLDVLADPAVTLAVETPSESVRLVTMASSTGTNLVATITVEPDGRYRFDRLASPGLSTSYASQIVEVPETGVLTVIGYDGGLGTPGETMHEGLFIAGPGQTDRLDLVESSWLRIDLTTPDGRVLRYLAPR